MAENKSGQTVIAKRGRRVSSVASRWNISSRSSVASCFVALNTSITSMSASITCPHASITSTSPSITSTRASVRQPRWSVTQSRWIVALSLFAMLALCHAYEEQRFAMEPQDQVCFSFFISYFKAADDIILLI